MTYLQLILAIHELIHVCRNFLTCQFHSKFEVSTATKHYEVKSCCLKTVIFCILVKMEKLFKKLGIERTVMENPFIVNRIENGTVVTNEFMYELLKIYKASKKNFSVFYELLRNLVPLDIYDRFVLLKINSFRSRIETFYKRGQKTARNPSKHAQFLKEEFHFVRPEKQDPDMPRKRALKKEIMAKDEYIKKRKLESEVLESSIEDLESSLEESQNKVDSLEDETFQLSAEKYVLQRRSAGLLSGLSRHKCSSSPVPLEGNIPVTTKDVKTNTEIKGVFGHIISIEHEESPSFHVGKRYFKYENGEGKKKLTSGFRNHYAELPLSKDPASKIGVKEIQKRAKLSMKFVSKIASPTDDDTETHLVLKEMIKANKDLFIKA